MRRDVAAATRVDVVPPCSTEIRCFFKNQKRRYARTAQLHRHPEAADSAAENYDLVIRP